LLLEPKPLLPLPRAKKGLVLFPGGVGRGRAAVANPFSAADESWKALELLWIAT
jgi:hypothetical protein